MREVVVLAGGQPPADERTATWRTAFATAPPDTVVAADSGLVLATPLGLQVDVVVGDLDSVDPDALRAAAAAGARIERHPVDKDATDVALALDAALAHAPDRITVVGGGGGRADHELSLWLLLASKRYADVRVRAWSPRAITDVVDPARDLDLVGRPGELCSLLPVHGAATGVWTAGLRYPLRGETLTAGTSRGVSNQLIDARASVTVGSGVLLVVRPGELGPPP